LDIFQASKNEMRIKNRKRERERKKEREERLKKPLHSPVFIFILPTVTTGICIGIERATNRNPRAAERGAEWTDARSLMLTIPEDVASAERGCYSPWGALAMGGAEDKKSDR
jgi:hypothetical protein